MERVFPAGTVVIDRYLLREDRSGQRRFTLAHEAAHLIFERMSPLAPGPCFNRYFDAEQNYSISELRERFNLCETQTDRLASVLLMPRFLTERTLAEHTDGRPIPVYGSGVITSRDKVTVQTMANAMGVSFSALLNRLRELGGELPLEENIALTYKVSEMCAAVGVPVEGEIGRVGGKEDDLESDGGYTIPEEAVRFEKESGLFSMAVGVGTAHGFYKEKPQLNKELITTLRGMLQAPMVLHGASGLSDEDVKDCIRRGICKVNFATELRAAYTEGVKAVLAENPKTFDPKAYGKEARQRVKALVMERMLVCGCDGKA